jgi:hypothetical protein
MTDAVEKVGCENGGVPAWLIWQILGPVQALGLAPMSVGLNADATN